MKTVLKVSIFFLFTAYSLFGMASEEGHHKDSETFDPVETIMHHIGDAHEFHIFTYNGHDVSIPLPVILYTGGHLDVFMSSSFEHGKKNVIKGDREYHLDHGKIVEKSGLQVLDFSITKNVFNMFISVALLLLIFISSARKYKGSPSAPRGIQRFTEPLVVFVRDEIALPNIGEKHHERFVPFLLTIFFFIWLNNVMGLIPIPPFGANLTGNIAVTGTLALFTFIITNINGKKVYWGHIFSPPGVPWWLMPLMIPLEIIGIFTKPISLMIRLFANITAGHIIVLSLISLIFIFKTWIMSFVSVPFVLFLSIIEIIVTAIQAYIFTLLSALYIGMAVAEDHH